MADFVEICKVCARKAIIEAAKRIINSDKVCHSYSDLNFGVTFLEHSVHDLLQLHVSGFQEYKNRPESLISLFMGHDVEQCVICSATHPVIKHVQAEVTSKRRIHHFQVTLSTTNTIPR